MHCAERYWQSVIQLAEKKKSSYLCALRTGAEVSVDELGDELRRSIRTRVNDVLERLLERIEERVVAVECLRNNPVQFQL